MQNVKNVRIDKQRINGFYFLILNSSIELFSSKMRRQAIFKYFIDKNIDIRPVRDDSFFVLEHQWFSKGSPGHLTKQDFLSIVKKFPTLSKQYDNKDVPVMAGPEVLDPVSEEKIYRPFRKLGMVLHKSPLDFTAKGIEKLRKSPFLHHLW